MEKAYTQKNTHLQTAQSQPQSQSLQESIFFSNPRQIKKQKSSPSQKNKSYSSDIQRYTDNEKEALGGNTGLAKVAVQYSAVTFVVNQSLVLRINICGENRHLRQARNR
jgi:hypothetical protein